MVFPVILTTPIAQKRELSCICPVQEGYREDSICVYHRQVEEVRALQLTKPPRTLRFGQRGWGWVQSI